MAIVKANISQQIYEEIKNKILMQEFKSGNQILVKDLAVEYNISTMPIRDALNKLTVEGLVERKPRVGYYVKKYTPKEVEEIMETRKMYELYCIDNHFDKIDKEKITEFLTEIESTKNFNKEHFNQLDMDFHDHVIQASNNSYFIKRFSKTRELVMLFRHMDVTGIIKANEYHVSLIKAILSGDKQKTKEILSKHIDNATNSILDYIASSGK